VHDAGATDTAAMSQPATIEGRLRLGTGFGEDERARIVETFSKLDKRLQRWTAAQVDMELSVKERESSSQQVTFECWIHADGDTRFVATSREGLLQDALMDCREDMWRQIDEFVTRRTNGRRK
jgi:ribosome-associated translation inhibitor RaiA